MAKNSMARATLPAEKLRLANRRMSSIGSSRRSSQPTNSAPASAATAKIVSVERDVQPCSGGLDDGVDERADRGDGQQRADRVEPGGVRVPGVGDEVQRADEARRRAAAR